MSASAKTTPNVHVLAAQQFISNLDNKNISVFAGQSIIWNDKDEPPIPVACTTDYEHIKKNIVYSRPITSKEAHIVIRRYTWRRNVVYTPWLPNKNMLYPESWLSENQPCYVISGDSVFMCISNNKGAKSTVKPRNTKSYLLQKDLSDGYMWKWICDIDKNLLAAWGSDEFIPLPMNNDEKTPDHIREELIVKNHIANGTNVGELVGVILTKNGRYSSESENFRSDALEVIVEGDGEGAEVEVLYPEKEDTDAIKIEYLTIKVVDYKGDPVIDRETGEQITLTKKIFTFSPIGLSIKNPGKGYTYANLKIVTKNASLVELKPDQFEAAEGIAVINPEKMLGANCLNDLCARFVSFKILFDGNENNIFPIQSTYRSVGLIKDIKYLSGEYITKPERYYDIIKLNNVMMDFTIQSTIEGEKSGTTANVLWINPLSKEQNYQGIEVSTVNLYISNVSGNFYESKSEYMDENENIISYKDEDGTVILNSIGTFESIDKSPVDKTSGDILYFINHNAIHRNIAQAEEFLFTLEL